jgi:hypothetical protein
VIVVLKQTSWFSCPLKVGKVLGAGSNDISRLSGDEGTVGVGHKSVVSVSGGVADGGNGKTLGGKVLSTGLLDSGLIDGDDSTVGMGNKTAKVAGISGGIGISSVVVVVGVSSISISASISTVGVSVVSPRLSSIAVSLVANGGKVGSLSSLDLRGLGGGDQAVSVVHQLGGGSSHTGEENLKEGALCERWCISLDDFHTVMSVSSLICKICLITETSTTYQKLHVCRGVVLR